MLDFFVLLWLASIVVISVFGVKLIRGFLVKKNLIKAKESSKSKLTNQQIKRIFIISIIVSVIAFIGIGVTAPPVEQSYKESETENKIEDENTNSTEDTNTDKNETEENKSEIIDEETIKKDLENKKNETLSNIPAYSNSPYIVINDNKPFFMESDLTSNSYENYSNLDELKRCGVAVASVGKDLMPTEDRGEIGSVKPTGWHSVKYNGIDGVYLYNRCHLIGFQLSGENANEKNLITGTRYMNVDGMLPFENMVADYVKETNNHVLYRVTPIYEGNNLLASGVLMEAKSVEDNGKGIEFNVYCYNVQPGIEINYSTGESSGPEYTGSSNSSATNNTSNSNTSNKTGSENDSKNQSSSNESNTSNNTGTATEQKKPVQENDNNNKVTSNYILNTNSKKFHEPNCGSASKISEKNKEYYNGTRESLIAQGYDPCGNCDP